MDSSSRKRILVAVDWSDQSLETVRYVSRILPSNRAEVVLFHVSSRVPASYWDSQKEPAFRYDIINVSEWERGQESIIRQFMDKSRRVLLEAGLPDDAIVVSVKERKAEIARDIMEESRYGYDAIVVGRTGVSLLKDMVLGSIANKLIERLSHMPLWVVGGRPRPDKILVGLDSSEGSMRAVRHVAQTLNDSPFTHVTLFHAVRGLESYLMGFGEVFVMSYDQSWFDRVGEEVDKSREEMKEVFKEARNCLVSAGFAPERVDCRIMEQVGSRSGAIVSEADQGGYDTIVVGRRGLSKVQEFIMGRVGSKVIQLAKKKAVWVVS